MEKQMTVITRGIAAGAVLFGAAVGLAGIASAHLSEGSYTRTMNAGTFAGVHDVVAVTSCGPDCLTSAFPNGMKIDFHLQGAAWTGTDPATGCVWSIDDNSLINHVDCHDGKPPVDWQWARNG